MPQAIITHNPPQAVITILVGVIGMNAWCYRWLCRFAYMDLPDGVRGRTLGELARELGEQSERGELKCGELSEEECRALSVISGTEELRNLVLIEYVNDNERSGLAACVFRSEDGEVHCVFRGSEKRGCGVSTDVDWWDNFRAPFCSSVQYAGIERLVHRFRGRKIMFSGHSKGAHNALYALSVCEGGARALVFNGQGFAPEQLDGEARRRLRERGVNYVVCGDAVGSVLYHPERRVFVKRKSGENAHALSAFSFDERGEAVEGVRPVWSAALEWGTRAYLFVRGRHGKCGNVVNRIASAPHS